MVGADRLGAAVCKGRFDAFFFTHEGRTVLGLSRKFLRLSSQQATDLTPIQKLMLQWAIERRTSHHERYMNTIHNATACVAMLALFSAAISAGGAVGAIFAQDTEPLDYEAIAVYALIASAALATLSGIGEVVGYTIMRIGEAACLNQACLAFDAGTLRTVHTQLKRLCLKRSRCTELINWGGDPQSYTQMAERAARERLRIIEQQQRETV